jgi:hypothetical protein
MKKSLSTVKNHFDVTMEYITNMEEIKKTKILYLGDMELSVAGEARKNGITPTVIYGRDQDVIDFVVTTDYSIVTVENGEGTAYFSPRETTHFDYVTDGESISQVLASDFSNNTLNLVVGDIDDNSLIELNKYTQTIVDKVYERRNIPEIIPQMKKIMERIR